MKAVPNLYLETFHFTPEDGTFGALSYPGRACWPHERRRSLRVRRRERQTQAQPTNGLLDTIPYHAAPTNYHVVAEINPAEGAATLTRDLVLETGRSLTVTALGPDGKPLTDLKIAGLKDMGYWETPPPDASTHTILDLTPSKPRTLTFLHAKKRLVGELVFAGTKRGRKSSPFAPGALSPGASSTATASPSASASSAASIFPEVIRPSTKTVVFASKA